MKPLMILIALLCVGCDNRSSIEAMHTDLQSFKYRGCEYLVYDERPYTSRFAFTHAGDCPNPKHGEGMK